MKNLARYAGTLAAKDIPLAADRNLHLNKVIQIADDVSPFPLPLLARQTIFEFLAQQQRQKRAKHMPAYRLASLVINRPRIEQRLHRPEDIFHHPRCLYFSANSAAGRSMLVVNTRLPS